MGSFPHLFSELTIRGKTVKNRIVMSPMGDNMACPDGSVSQQWADYYVERARGGAGIITPAIMCVDYPRGKGTHSAARIDAPKYVNQLFNFSEKVHRYGALVIPQLHHTGGKSDITMTEGEKIQVSYVQEAALEGQVFGRSGENYHMLTIDEIHDVQQKFINSAVYCKQAGCDGVLLHGAHGYLINDFLSPFFNKRTDRYGGSFENRLRFAIEIIEGIRSACGDDFILGIRMVGHEFVAGGMTDEECAESARRFEQAGCDYFDVSFGAQDIPSRVIETERYAQGNRIPYAENIKRAVQHAKVGTVGNFRDPSFCDEVIAAGTLDFISVGRALICDPYWPEKARAGRPEDIRPCLSCSDGCFGNVSKNRSIRCVLNPEAGRERECREALARSSAPKRVLVIGGGPGGMQAAVTAARAGHQVTLAEAENRLGGLMNLACRPPFKYRIGNARDWFARELVKAGVTVKMNTRADMDFVDAMKPDAVIFAGGADPIRTLPIPGSERAVLSWDVIDGRTEMPSGTDVAVIGGGLVGCETAEMLLEHGNTVSIIDMLPSIANDYEWMHRMDLLRIFNEKGVAVYTNARVLEIGEDCVTFEQDGKAGTIPAACVIMAVGHRPAGAGFVDALREKGYKVTVVGEAKRPGKIINAVSDGFFAGTDL